MHVAPEQTPLPCQRCGAAMEAEVQGALYGNLLPMACRYCGARETLAHDDRLRVSRERVAMLRMAQDAAEAPARQVDALVAMRPWLGGVVVGGVIALQGLGQVGAAREAVARAGDAMGPDARFEALRAACVTPAVGFGMAAGMFVGWGLALRRYRTLVSATRRARAPRYEGGPARCRCCGADLPAQWGAFTPCGFCGTHNLLDRALLDAREASLVAETALYQQRAAGVIARANAFTPAFTRWSVAGAVAGAFLFGLAGMALAAALAR